MRDTVVKTAASKLRALLMLGKLRPEQVSRLRTAGMLPSRQRYASGLRKGLESVMRKELLRTRAVLGPGNISVVKTAPLRAEIEPVGMAAGDRYLPLGGTMTWHLPVVRTRGASGKRINLHDLLTVWHEMLEHRGRYRSGGGLEFTAPLSKFTTDLSHNPGVLSGERTLYERIVNQLGGRNPDYGRFRVAGSETRRGDLPEELARSVFSWRDETRLMRLLRRLESVKSQQITLKGRAAGREFRWGDLLRLNGANLTQQGMGNLSGSATEAAAELARAHGNRKLLDYFNAYNRNVKTVHDGAGVSGYNVDAIRTKTYRQPDSPASVWEAYLHPQGAR